MSDNGTTFEARMRARQRRGHLLVAGLALLNALLTIVAFLGSAAIGSASFSRFITTMLWLFVFAMLYMGKTWAKWLFIIAAAIGVLALIMMLGALPALSSAPTGILIAVAIDVLGVIVMVISALLLLFSGPVNDFLYDQDTSY